MSQVWNRQSDLTKNRQSVYKNADIYNFWREKQNWIKKKSKSRNDDSETDCEDEDISNADSATNNEFEENPDMNESWYCFVSQSDGIMTMRLCP